MLTQAYIIESSRKISHSAWSLHQFLKGREASVNQPVNQYTYLGWDLLRCFGLIGSRKIAGRWVRLLWSLIYIIACASSPYREAVISPGQSIYVVYFIIKMTLLRVVGWQGGFNDYLTEDNDIPLVKGGDIRRQHDTITPLDNQGPMMILWETCCEQLLQVSGSKKRVNQISGQQG